MKKLLCALVVSTLCLQSGFLSAAIVKKISTVQTVVVENTGSDQLGGCAVKLLGTVGGTCNKWVSFDCTGEFNAKDKAYRMLDNATMAYALGKNVQVHVDNTQKKSGAYCVVKRIDVLQ